MTPRKPTSEPPVSPESATSNASRGAPRNRSFSIVGIDASAEGLEKHTALFKALSRDPGMACVLAPQLDPQGESAVSRILGRASTVPVAQIEDGMTIEPDHVYVVPPNCDVSISNLRLNITDRADQPRSAAGTDREAEPLTESERAGKEKQIAQLRLELAATREYLQSIIEMQEATNEELQSANKEIQSGNEELQSTNEELQTSREELESANKELHTVNEEMQHRNDLLTQANNDLTNLLNSVNLPMVMVSSALTVRRFTPQATAVLGLMPSDIGRPIPRLRLKIDVRSLEQMMLEVIQEVQPRHERVQDEEGHWFHLRVTPYRTLDNRIDGVVLTVVDGNSGIEADGRSRLDGKAAKKSGTMTKKKSASNKKR